MFWSWFDSVAAPSLGLREPSFRKIFRYLDDLEANRPLCIVETGCLREAGNWAGDGQSTLLFAEYLKWRPRGGEGYSIDIDPAATSACKAAVGERFNVITGDSVLNLAALCREFSLVNKTIDFLYLDSFDVDWDNIAPSANHHLKEMVAIYECLTPTSLVVVDDSPATAYLSVLDDGHVTLLNQPKISGKGKLVAEFALSVGARPLFSHYQAGWVGFKGA